ncbi:sulfate permease-like protein [Cucurbitaria berberidis CBS 394.84]|uniref:Sulfate permease-like protein n=1 Tax=Cucurbitaria berberidis CBS 394.84 TaxID=1168544 RepID=A0A9P4L9P5_9PLEO|nr:sulfate permease-like protein [Cucurbitaria berberidis CBS 394.84]KAF1846424.1 sulfate permease-like protein [Cucurbitaria berberidis CBS 394.84]
MSGNKIKAFLNNAATKALPTSSHQHSKQKQTASLEKIARETIGTAYLEEDPSVAEWFRGLVPSSSGVAEYVQELFPSARWVRRYNIHWLVGDAIAGITVGLVVVPQAMAYALLARLTPAFGLYTTFTGACLYWVFGTSKDIVIGTTAVGSLLVGSVISKIEADHPGVYKPEDIAHVLSFLAGAVLFVLGILRLGWLIEFIPYVPISAFVTSASITIISTQLPTVLGIPGINTRESPYMVYVNTLKELPNARLDAAIGITSIMLLWLIRDVCAKMEFRQPNRKRMWSLVSSLRLTFTILLYTFISWLVHRKAPVGQERFRIVGHIEKGFSHAGIPPMDGELFGLVASELPAIIIILIVEHIAIAKSFGRIFNYTIIPSQEMIAQGAANILSPFVGGYVCTGSFGASAVLSKAAVRTPLAGLFSALVLILALYALTAVFYYIPNAALAGLIIHCTVNLITPPRSLYKYWQLSPFELFIWVCGVVIAFFTNLETAIYVTIGLSFAILLIRMAKSPGKFTGSVGVTRIVRNSRVQEVVTSCSSSDKTVATQREGTTAAHASESRQVYLPYDTSDAHNPDIKVEPAYPGVFIYRFSENFNYINQASHIDYLSSYIMKNTRRTLVDDGIRASDRLWCDAPPPAKLGDEKSALPVLRAVVLDFSTINNIDITSVQGLLDLRNTLDRFAAPAVVEWHFAGVQNRWTRRALAFAGFGFPAISSVDELADWCPAYTVATGLVGATEEELRDVETLQLQMRGKNAINRGTEPKHNIQLHTATEKVDVLQPIYGIDRPLFHIDLHDAVDAAVRDAKKQAERDTAASHSSNGWSGSRGEP